MVSTSDTSISLHTAVPCRVLYGGARRGGGVLEVNKFKQASSDHHQMSLVEGVSGLMYRDVPNLTCPVLSWRDTPPDLTCPWRQV